MRPPAKVYYKIEILDTDRALVRSVTVRGYRPTVHRVATMLMNWEASAGYQLRRERDGAALDYHARTEGASNG